VASLTLKTSISAFLGIFFHLYEINNGNRLYYITRFGMRKLVSGIKKPSSIRSLILDFTL